MMDRPKRLLIVSPIFPNPHDRTKGVFIKQLVVRLSSTFHLKVISPIPWGAGKGLPDQEMQDGIETYYPRHFIIPKIGRALYGFFYFFSLVGFVRKMYKRFAWDAAIVHWAYPDAFGMALINCFIKRPLFVYVLGSDINIYTQFFLRRMMIKYALKKAARVFSVAYQLRDKMVALGVAKDHVLVIPTGVNTDLFYPMDKTLCRENLGLPQDKKIILFIGHLVKVKGLRYFILAALSLLKKRSDLLFLIVGEGSDRGMLQKMISEGNAEGEIALLGGKPHAEIPLWINSCDLFCLPSLSEGCPNVVLETLACGRPVVGADVGDVAHLIGPGLGKGMVVPPGESEPLADAIDRALDKTWDPNQIAQLIHEYTWEGASQKISTEVMRHIEAGQFSLQKGG